MDTAPSLPHSEALAIAMEHHLAGRLVEAEEIYRKILALDPLHPDALRLMGLVAYQVGKNDIALDMISRAIAIRPDSAVAHFNLGLVYAKLGQVDDAAVSMRTAVTLQPSFIEAQLQLWVLCYRHNAKFLFEAPVGIGAASSNSAIGITDSYFFIRNRSHPHPPATKALMHFSLNGSDRFQFGLKSVFSRKHMFYQEAVLVLCRILNDGDIVVDVGANCGYFTVVLGRLVGPTGRVIAIEPNPRHEQILRHHIAVNEVNADVCLKAVSDCVGTARFSESGYALHTSGING